MLSTILIFFSFILIMYMELRHTIITFFIFFIWNTMYHVKHIPISGFLVVFSKKLKKKRKKNKRVERIPFLSFCLTFHWIWILFAYCKINDLDRCQYPFNVFIFMHFINAQWLFSFSMIVYRFITHCHNFFALYSRLLFLLAQYWYVAHW